MRMAADYDAEAGRGRVEIQLVNVVKNVDPCRAGFNHRRLGQSGCPCGFVDIAPDGDHRSQHPQALENLRIAHVSGVDDEIGSCKRSQRLLAKQAVGVRDYADSADKPRHFQMVTAAVEER